METTSSNEGKTIAIISYITVIGLIIAYVMNREKRNSFADFHIRQSLGILLLAIVASIFLYGIGIPIISLIVRISIFVLWILGLISAVKEETKVVPVLGKQFQEWFKGI